MASIVSNKTKMILEILVLFIANILVMAAAFATDQPHPAPRPKKFNIGQPLYRTRDQ